MHVCRFKVLTEELSASEGSMGGSPVRQCWSMQLISVVSLIIEIIFFIR